MIVLKVVTTSRRLVFIPARNDTNSADVNLIEIFFLFRVDCTDILHRFPELLSGANAAFRASNFLGSAEISTRNPVFNIFWVRRRLRDLRSVLHNLFLRLGRNVVCFACNLEAAG